MKPETKVGLMFIAAIILVVAFAFMLGAFNPFSNAHRLNVAFNFAGGIEVGSPVRVMGIKVGKVKSIEFDSKQQMPSGEEVKLRVVVEVNKEAWPTLREDSQYFINLAGVIGEKYLEISPGSLDKPLLKPGALVRGEDPPRIDQLISQSYGLAGKIFEFVESNEGSVIDTINTMNKLVTNLNSVLKAVDQTTGSGDGKRLVKNLVTISDDVAFFTKKLRSSEGQETIRLVNDLIHRLDPLDAKAIKKFLQEEGIRARMF